MDDLAADRADAMRAGRFALFDVDTEPADIADAVNALADALFDLLPDEDD